MNWIVLHIRLDVAVVMLAEYLGHDFGDILADELFPFVFEHVFYLWVAVHDVSDIGSDSVDGNDDAILIFTQSDDFLLIIHQFRVGLLNDLNLLFHLDCFLQVDCYFHKKMQI